VIILDSMFYLAITSVYLPITSKITQVVNV